MPLATGKNVLKAAILTAIGRPFSRTLLKDTKHLVGVTGSIWPKPGKIRAISGIEKARKIAGVGQIFFRSKVGDVVKPYTDGAKRVCFIIASGKTEPEARAVLQKAIDTIKISIE